MALVKEDGSLDIEGINNLPIEQYMSEIGSLSKEQYEEYCNAQRTDEPDYPAFAIQSSCPMEEDGVDALEFLQRMKKNTDENIVLAIADYNMTIEELQKHLHKGPPRNADGSGITYEQARQLHLIDKVKDVQPVHVEASLDEILALGFIPLDDALNKIGK